MSSASHRHFSIGIGQWAISLLRLLLESFSGLSLSRDVISRSGFFQSLSYQLRRWWWSAVRGIWPMLVYHPLSSTRHHSPLTLTKTADVRPTSLHSLSLLYSCYTAACYSTYSMVVVDAQCSMLDGRWSVVDGQWSMVGDVVPTLRICELRPPILSQVFHAG